jgi:putative redox protein
MNTHAVTTTQTGPASFTSDIDGHSLLSSSEAGIGPSPKKLLLAGLGGCTGLDVASILTKMHVAYTSLKIVATATLTEEHPKVYNHIQLDYYVGADEADREKIQRAIQLSADTYCGVMAMLSKTAQVQIQLHLQQQAPL